MELTTMLLGHWHGNTLYFKLWTKSTDKSSSQRWFFFLYLLLLLIPMLLFLLLLLYYITAKLKLFKLISWWYYFWYLTYIQRLEVLLKEGYQEVFKHFLLHNNKNCVIRIIAFLHLFLYPYIQLLACSSHRWWSLMGQTWLTLGPYLVARHEI